MGQEHFFDSTERPWRYDANVGATVAPPQAGEGDGAYRYTTDPETGCLVVEKNPHPTNAAQGEPE